MATALDLDDVAAGNPKAERELAELRAENERLRAQLKRLRGCVGEYLERVNAYTWGQDEPTYPLIEAMSITDPEGRES